MPFCVSTCPKCSGRFRLRWRIGKRKLPMSTVVRLTCPTCGHGFEQVAVKLVVFYVGAEHFPKSVVVEESALLLPGASALLWPQQALKKPETPAKARPPL